MSQVYLGVSSTPAVPTQFTTDSGIAVPVAGNLNILGTNGITTSGAGSTVTISTDTEVGTAETIGAVTADILTIDLGAVAGTVQFEARCKGFEATGPAGCGYNLYGTFTTTGSPGNVATLVGFQPILNEDASLAAANVTYVASGNNAVLRVLGVAGLTINWSAESEQT
jgi:hypothetical protein